MKEGFALADAPKTIDELHSEAVRTVYAALTDAADAGDGETAASFSVVLMNLYSIESWRAAGLVVTPSGSPQAPSAEESGTSVPEASVGRPEAAHAQLAPRASLDWL